MPENRIPRKALQYRPQGKRDLPSFERSVHVVLERELLPKSTNGRRRKRKRRRRGF